MNIEDSSTENDNQLMEVFNVEIGKECKEFRPNKCPIQFGKGKDYNKFSGNKFRQAKIKKFDNSNLLLPAIISIISFFIVTYLLVVAILVKNIFCIILFCLNYIFAFIIQLYTFPNPRIYNSI